MLAPRTVISALGFALVAPLILSACGSQPDKNGDSDQSEDKDVVNTVAPRGPAALPTRASADSILGNVKDGVCDPTVIDNDHGKPLLILAYAGQPGDVVDVIVDHFNDDGVLVRENGYFDLTGDYISAYVPVNIANETITKVQIKARGKVGEPGECVIPINGASGAASDEPEIVEPLMKLGGSRSNRAIDDGILADSGTNSK